MPQSYFLSVTANAFVGLLLASDYLGQRSAFFAEWRKLLGSRTAQIGIAAVAIAIGVLKLVAASPGETVPVVGDLLPALTGLALGVALLAEAFRAKVEASGSSVQKVAHIAVTYRVPLGVAGVLVAALHFLFPGTLFL